MSPLDRRLADLESRIRDVEAENTSLRHALRNVIRTGTVSEYDAATDRAVVIDEVEGDDGNGKAETPPARVLGQTGGVKKRTTLKAGEQVLVISPGGDYGETSLVLPLGPNEANPSPSDHGSEDLTIIGSTTQRLREDGALLASDKVDLGAEGGPPVARIGDQVLVMLGSSAGLWPIVTGAEKTNAV
jgi:hypothetical protein